MSAPTPEDRPTTVERHIYTILALADGFEALSVFAHLTNASHVGFLVGFLAERLQEEADAALKAAEAAGREARP